MIAMPLSSTARAAALRALAVEELDVLVIGGGVVGAGAALDAASRGLRVGLVEARDWASGTSSRSSKLIHGGLRYLEMLDFRLVFEALRERGLLMKIVSPHLVRSVQFLYPLRHRIWERLYIGAGILLYDVLAILGGNQNGLRLHRHLSRSGAKRELPGLARDALIGAIRYSDAQVDDARHTMTVVRTAVSLGAHAANRTRVSAILSDAGRATGAVLVDQETGQSITVRAKRIINAGGVWTDELQKLAGTSGEFHVHASKGVHIVVERERIPGDSGLILRTEKSVLFVIPWGRHWVIGTTDTEWRRDLAHPAVSSGDVDYILDHVNTVLEHPLTTDDVQGVYAGLRPLVAGTAETSKLSREHQVSEPLPHFVVVAGGKYTTYRVMAKDAVDVAVRGLEGTPASGTHRIPLVGAHDFAARWAGRAETARGHGLPIAEIERLMLRYGVLVDELLEKIAEDRSLAIPLRGGGDYLRVEALYAVTHEGARHLDDILARRTRLSIGSWDRGVDSAQEVAELVAEVLHWGPEEIDREVEAYLDRVSAEREAQEQPDDAHAEGSRLSAQEIVPLR